MTWSVSIYKLDGPHPGAEGAFAPRILGRKDEVRRRLVGSLPGLWWAGPSGRLAGNGWVMEMTLWRRMAPARGGSVDAVEIDVRGGGDPIAPLIHLCRQQGWQLFDDGSGAFVDLERPSAESWERVRRSAHRRAAVLGDPRARREILVYDLDGPPQPAEDLLYRRFPIGDAEDVRDWIEEILPEVVWSGRRGRARVDGTELDFRLRSHGLVDTFSFHARGPDADRWVEALCRPNGWSAYDCTVGRFTFLHDSSRPEPLPEAAMGPLPDNVIPFPIGGRGGRRAGGL